MFAQKLKILPATIVFSAAAMGVVFPTCSYNMKKIKLGKVSFILLLNTLATTTKESCQLLFKQLFWSVLKITKKNLIIVAFKKAWSPFIELKSGHVTPKALTKTNTKKYTDGSSTDRKQQKYIIKKEALKAVRATLLLLLFSC